MTTLAAIRNRDAIRPSVVRVIRKEHFAGTWDGRPDGEHVIGLRRLSAKDVEQAAREAAKAAGELDGDEAVRAYNDALVTWSVGLAHCDPNDTTQPSALLEVWGNDTVSERLTVAAIRWLFSELEALHASDSPIWPMPTVDELRELARLVTDEATWKRVAGAKGRRALRMLGHILDELREPEDDEG